MNAELINKLQNTLNKSIIKNDLDDETTELSNELFETLKVIENCKEEKKKIDRIDLSKFHESINEIESRLTELEEEEEEEEEEWYTIIEINSGLFQINIG